MRGPYSDYAAPPIHIYPDTRKPGIRFSSTEIRQLVIAVLAMSGAFTVLSIRYNPAYLTSAFILAFLFVVSLLSVGTGLGLHEIMHKVVAQRYGHWAEFRYDPRALAMAFVFAIIGFIYGAPGATLIAGDVTTEQYGKISAAGPTTNLVIGSAALAGTVALGFPATDLGFLVFFALAEIAFVNIVFAGFNLVPILPLDGAKVWHWNKGLYVLLVAVVLLLLAYALVNGFLI